MKRNKYLKLFIFSLFLLVFLIPRSPNKFQAAEEELLLINDIPEHEEEQPEYTYVDISDIENSVPIYSSSDISASYNQFAVNSPYSIDNLYGYSTLSDTLKQYYNVINNAFSQFMNGDYKSKDYSTTQSYINVFAIEQNGASINDLMKAYWSFRNDHPEYYWISNYFSYSNSSTGANVFIMMDSSYAKAADRAACETLITDKIQEYITATSKCTNAYDKILAVHDKIINEVDYAYNSKNKPEEAIWAHNVIGLFNGKGVVCEGYAKGFQLILNHLGIKNIYVVGYAGEAHAWSYVCIEDKYYAIDVTWDDLGKDKYGGISYQYFCMPGNYFKSSHTTYTTSGNPLNGQWLYSLPTLQNGMENTYYQKYNALATNITSANTSNFIAAAKAKAPGDYVHILSDSASLNNIANALGAKSYISVSKYGNYTALIIVEELKVLYPATSISLTSDMLTGGKIEINRDDTQAADVSLIAVIAHNDRTSDDRISWSSSSSIVQIVGSGTTVKLIPKRNGEAIITAKAAKGNITVECRIIITGSSVSESMYLDSAYTQKIFDEDITIWVNGGSVKIGNDKVNYKKSTIYTDIKPSTITTIKNGKPSTKSGKLIVGVTMSSEEPELVNGKIVDADAAKIAKASIKNGVITLTAQKQPGTVYVWVIDTGDEADIGYAPVTVMTAPSKITIIEELDKTTAFKKVTIPIDEYDMLYLLPTIDKNGTTTKDADYYVTPAAKAASCIEISRIKDNDFLFTAIGLLNNKTTKVKLTAYCSQNAKKAAITVTINNPVRDLAPSVSASSFSQKNDVITVTLNESAASNEYQTTMKPVVYIMTEPGLSLDSKQKLMGTQAKDIAARISSDKKSFTLTLKKAPEAVAANHHIYVLFKEGKECKLFYIGYIDKDSLVFTASATD